MAVSRGIRERHLRGGGCSYEASVYSRQRTALGKPAGKIRVTFPTRDQAEEWRALMLATLSAPPRVSQRCAPVPKLTSLEAAVEAELIARGARVYRNGWPDFLVVENGVVRAVEVKARHQYLSPYQADVYAVLTSIGLPVEIIWPEGR